MDTDRISDYIAFINTFPSSKCNTTNHQIPQKYIHRVRKTNRGDNMKLRQGNKEDTRSWEIP